MIGRVGRAICFSTRGQAQNQTVEWASDKSTAAIPSAFGLGQRI
jgi:hypothetical protein